jgi:hypothetical protein
MSAGTEMLGDGAIGGEEPLGVARGFESPHTPLPLASGLVRVLSAVVEIPMLPMFHPREEFSLSSSVALEFVSHNHTRHIRQFLE